MTTTADPRPLRAGIIGWPIRHSKSPVIFGHWFAETGIAGTYDRFAVEPGTVQAEVDALIAQDLRGINVTLPHKVTALEIADTASEAARAIGAANTLTFSPEGRIHADNTDAFGFTESLKADTPSWRAEAGPALVLGAGGASRAVIHALLAEGAPQIRLANRTAEKAQALADHFGARVTVIAWAERSAATAGAATIVNTSSLGMTGFPPLEIALDDAPPQAIVADIVYTPLETGLLAQARARGLMAVDGLGMLLNQARPSFRAWFGRDMTVTPALRRAVLDAA